MIALTVRQSPTLLNHLKIHDHDGATVETALFEGGRLQYPGRQQIEQQLGFMDPYTIELESRVLVGFFQSVTASIRLLSRAATETFRGQDETLDLLWDSHNSYVRPSGEGPSLDRLVAALVMVEHAKQTQTSPDIEYACLVLIRGLSAAGFPPGQRALDELWADCPPACIGLGLITLG